MDIQATNLKQVWTAGKPGDAIHNLQCRRRLVAPQGPQPSEISPILVEYSIWIREAHDIHIHAQEIPEHFES
jgi:hypothetical protein